MVELRISYRAEKDLDDIRIHGVREFGAIAATEYLSGFYRVFKVLRDHPQAGEAKEQYGRGLRSFSHRPHRVLYRLQGGTILIVRVLHHARDVRSALRQRA